MIEGSCFLKCTNITNYVIRFISSTNIEKVINYDEIQDIIAEQKPNMFNIASTINKLYSKIEIYVSSYCMIDLYLINFPNSCF